MSEQNGSPAFVKTPRRQKSSKPSIYFRLDAKGRRSYEYVYRDSAGKQRWVGGFSTIKDAEDARGEVVRRIRRGERVAPIKETLVAYARTWLDGQTQLKDSTRARYSWAIETHIAQHFGKLKVGEVTEDHIAALVADMQKDYAPSTIRAVLAPLSLILGRAVRRGAIAHNAVAGLERRERPQGQARAMRILAREEIGQLIEATAPEHRPLISTLIFGGLRVSELIGLRWADVDHEHGQLHVRGQLDHKTRKRTTTKTRSSTRTVVLIPSLGKMLAAHRLASKFSADTDPVFATTTGTPMNRDNIRTRVLAPAVKRAGLDHEGLPKLRTHDLRHTFASLLIAGGASVVFLSAQLGHANPAITLSIYAHLFDARDHADRLAEILEAGFGNTLETAMRGEAQADAVSAEEVTRPLRAVADGRG